MLTAAALLAQGDQPKPKFISETELDFLHCFGAKLKCIRKVTYRKKDTDIPSNQETHILYNHEPVKVAILLVHNNRLVVARPTDHGFLVLLDSHKSCDENICITIFLLVC